MLIHVTIYIVIICSCKQKELNIIKNNGEKKSINLFQYWLKTSTTSLTFVDYILQQQNEGEIQKKKASNETISIKQVDYMGGSYMQIAAYIL